MPSASFSVVKAESAPPTQELPASSVSATLLMAPLSALPFFGVTRMALMRSLMMSPLAQMRNHQIDSPQTSSSWPARCRYMASGGANTRIYVSRRSRVSPKLVGSVAACPI